MRRVLPFLLLLAVAACNLPETRWEKEGVTDAMAMNDLNYCRKAARDEAFGAYPYGFDSPFYGFHRWATWDNDRYVAESRLTQFCMRAKGYQRVTVSPPQATPPTKS
jgi:hypothetical protein